MLKELLSGEVSQQEVLNYYNASIFIRNIPIEVRGYVFSHNDINCIVLNENISYYKRKKTLLHELAHIELNQLCQADSDLFEYHRQGYEDEADKYIEFLKENIKND